MTNTSPALIMVLLDEHLAAWFALPGAVPSDQRIEGKRGWMLCRTAAELVQGVDDLLDRLRELLRTGYQMDLLHDDASRSLLTKALPKLASRLGTCVWQIQRWEAWADRCGVQRDASPRPTCDWIAEHILPLLLVSEDASARRRMKEATQREHASFAGQLQAERDQLQRDNDTLRAQNDTLRRVDAERLIVYLPALFPRIFTEIGGQDLALLTGRPEPYALPNPYPEPSPETLHTLQRDFRTLPRELQRQIVAFIARLPQRQKLKPRPEMRELVLGLESE